MSLFLAHFKKYVKLKWSRYRPDVAQRVGRGIALLYHDRGTRRRWVVSSTPRPHFTPGKDPLAFLQEAGWTPRAGLEGGEWSAARPGRTLPPRKTRYPFYRMLGGPQGLSGRAENFAPILIRSRTVQSVVSRYTDWATGPTFQVKYIQHIQTQITQLSP